MSKSNATRKNKRSPAKDLIAQLSPAGRQKYLEMELACNFHAFVMKVFEPVSAGDVFP
jgi:hypothetical protein